MRLLNALLLVLVLALSASVALANPNTPPEEKEWHWVLGSDRTTYTEIEPNDACPGPQLLQCGDIVDPGMISTTTDDDWYQVYLTAGTLVTIGTDAGTGCTGVNDSYLYLYSPDCATQLAYDDDSGPGFYSLITYTVPATGNYNVKVMSYAHAYTGCYKLFITCSVPTPPDPNDTCAGAIAITDCTTGAISGNTQWDTDNYNPGTPGPSCTGYSAAGKDVAYVLSLNAGDVCHFDYLQPSADASFYIVTDCSNVSASCVIGADQTVTGQDEIIDWTVPTTGTYYLILDSYTSAYGGPWSLSYTITCPPPPTPAVCCRPDGSCFISMPADCMSPNIFHPEWLVCDPNPCPPPPPVGACCNPQTGACTLTVQSACAYNWHPEWTSCDPNPCPPPVPAEKSTWGQLKHTYR